jgi:hypothetical protein
MYFEIIGEITGVETFGSGGAIREFRGFESCMGEGAGENAKDSRRCDCPTAARGTLNCIGTRRTASAAKSLRLSDISIELAVGTPSKKFVVCLKNTGYEASLEPRKIYQTIADTGAAKHQQIRVIDESGEDYLYPQNFFAPIDLPPPIRKAVLAAV